MPVQQRYEPKSTENQADLQKCNNFDHFMKSIATPAVRLSVLQQNETSWVIFRCLFIMMDKYPLEGTYLQVSVERILDT